jgi:hypothetical protein
MSASPRSLQQADLASNSSSPSSQDLERNACSAARHEAHANRARTSGNELICLAHHLQVYGSMSLQIELLLLEPPYARHARSSHNIHHAHHVDDIFIYIMYATTTICASSCTDVSSPAVCPPARPAINRKSRSQRDLARWRSNSVGNGAGYMGSAADGQLSSSTHLQRRLRVGWLGRGLGPSTPTAAAAAQAESSSLR